MPGNPPSLVPLFTIFRTGGETDKKQGRCHLDSIVLAPRSWRTTLYQVYPDSPASFQYFFKHLPLFLGTAHPSSRFLPNVHAAVAFFLGAFIAVAFDILVAGKSVTVTGAIWTRAARAYPFWAYTSTCPFPARLTKQPGFWHSHHLSATYQRPICPEPDLSIAYSA